MNIPPALFSLDPHLPSQPLLPPCPPAVCVSPFASVLLSLSPLSPAPCVPLLFVPSCCMSVTLLLLSLSFPSYLSAPSLPFPSLSFFHLSVPSFLAFPALFSPFLPYSLTLNPPLLPPTPLFSPCTLSLSVDDETWKEEERKCV